MTTDTIKINDVDYEVEKLPREVQTMVGLYRRWENELTEAKIKVAMIENALQNIGGQVIRSVELPKAAENVANVGTALN